jgi:hypothetical protein
VSAARLWHATVALLALAGLAIEYWVTLTGHAGEAIARTIRFLSFFTILTNALVMLASIGAAFGRGRLHRWTAGPGVSTAISVHITVVAVIFQLLLARLVHLTPLGWWGNLLVHRLVPASWLIGWVAFARHGGIARWSPLRWLIYPLLYGIWTIAHGAVVGWYPYPFLDVTKQGLAAVGRNMLLMALFFAAPGYGFRWIDGRLATWRKAPA